MKFYLTILLISALSFSVKAQNGEITFLAEDLQDVALRYTGDNLTWPIIVSLADRDIQNNSFTLTQSDIQQLETLSGVTAKVLEQKTRMKNLIADGASVFANDELIDAALAISNYNEALKNGNINDAISFGNSIKDKVDIVEETLLKNRMVEVQALLEAKKVMLIKGKDYLVVGMKLWLEIYLKKLMDYEPGSRVMLTLDLPMVRKLLWIQIQRLLSEKQELTV